MRRQAHLFFGSDVRIARRRGLLGAEATSKSGEDRWWTVALALSSARRVVLCPLTTNGSAWLMSVRCWGYRAGGVTSSSGGCGVAGCMAGVGRSGGVWTLTTAKPKRSRRGRRQPWTRASAVTVRRGDGSVTTAPAYGRRELVAVVHGRRGGGVHL